MTRGAVGGCGVQDKGLQEMLYEKTKGATEAAASLAATLQAQLAESGTKEVRATCATVASLHTPLPLPLHSPMRERVETSTEYHCFSSLCWLYFGLETPSAAVSPLVLAMSPSRPTPLQPLLRLSPKLD